MKTAQDRDKATADL